MKRTVRDNRDRPHPKPVESIELSGENVGMRLFFAVAFLLLGVGMLVYALFQFLSPQSEWVAIESGAGTGCGEEFTLLYHPGAGEMSSAEERKGVSALYSQLCQTAYQQFSSREEFEGVNNVYAINRHPNETLVVDRALYDAFAVSEASGSRLLYMGPVYNRYDDVFFCEDDSQLADFDPRLSEDVAREYRDVLAFANDPGAVRLELLGENKVRLSVSEAYLAYAAQEEFEDFIDFTWTRNAFIADYMARELTARGYVHGVLSSSDGFIRNLDDSGTDYSLQILDRREGGAYVAALAAYRGPMSVVSLWDYPAYEQDRYRFYVMDTGEVRTPYLDPADGLCRSAVRNLTGYARDKGCGELLMALAPVYIADELSADELVRMAAEGVQSVYCQDGVVWHTDPALKLSHFNEEQGGRYTPALLEP